MTKRYLPDLGVEARTRTQGRWDHPTVINSPTMSAMPKLLRYPGHGGAEGIRTPDLLIANETRYQLRHSPLRQQEYQRSRGRMKLLVGRTPVEAFVICFWIGVVGHFLVFVW